MNKTYYEFICGECSHEFKTLDTLKAYIECPYCGSLNTYAKGNQRVETNEHTH